MFSGSRAVMLVDLHAPPLVRLQADRFEIEVVGRTDAAGGEQHHVGDDVLSGLELDEALALGHLDHLDALHRFAAAEGDVRLAHLVDELVDDLVVEELQRPGAPVDHRHLHPQGGEHRSVLDADDPGPDHGDAARHLSPGRGGSPSS